MYLNRRVFVIVMWGLDTFVFHFLQGRQLLLSCTPSPFGKGIYSERKEVLEWIPLQKVRKNNLAELPPMKMYQFPLSLVMLNKFKSHPLLMFSQSNYLIPVFNAN